jgi:hypothetical protein
MGMMMTGSAQQFALQTNGRSQRKGRSPLAHLLHALNQPLTGLQCSLELAVTGPRPQEEYVRTLHEALELACRMRLLVEAMRELADAQQPAEVLVDKPAEKPVEGQDASLCFDAILRETVEELRPVAAARNIQLQMDCPVALPVHAGPGCMPARVPGRIEDLLFRLLDSVVSLAREASDLELRGAQDGVLMIRWCAGCPPKHSPFSAPELGLLVAQAAWQQMGGQWSHTIEDSIQRLTLELPRSEVLPTSNSHSSILIRDPLSHRISGHGFPGDAP